MSRQERNRRVQAMFRREREKELTEAPDLVPYLRGTVGVAPWEDGLVIPQRVYPKQLEVLDDEGRGHRARATAGCAIDLVTDGDEVRFDCAIVRDLDHGHDLYRLVTEHVGQMGRAEGGVVDGIDVAVAGSTRTLPVTDGEIRVGFPNPGHERLEVLIYLPCIMTVAVGSLRCNGTLEPAPRRDYLLALGDSITQGFVVGSPSRTYPARVAAALELDHINQGIAGFVFDRRSLRGLSALQKVPPRVITVGYGTNDWTRKTSLKEIRQDAERFLDKLCWYFPETPVYVLTPTWRADEERREVPSGVPLSAVRDVLRELCGRSDQLHLVDTLDAYQHDPVMLADGYLHPGAVAMQLVAERVVDAIRGVEPASAPVAALGGADGAAHGADWRAGAPVSGSGSATETSKGAGMSDEQQVSKNGAASQPDTAEGRLAAACASIDAETAARDGSPASHPEWDRVVRMIWRLRQPDGCPWDKAQTHESITRDMIGEAYEAVDAIERGSVDDLREELGDVLEQVLLQSQIAADAGEFTIDDVCRGLDEKLVRRHPHVFGDVLGTGVNGDPATSDEVGSLWDEVKKTEREAKGDDAPAGMLDSVPIALPALMQAQKISKRAAKAGFEWDSVDSVWKQVEEERGEFEAEEPGSDAAALEFGDLLFALVNVARWNHIDAEAALEASNRKFRRRWGRMEELARAEHVELEELSTARLNELWDRVKAEERAEK